MLTALTAGFLVAGAAWCWPKLVAPWVRTHELHEEVLKIQRELALPLGRPWSPEVDCTNCTQDLANLAAAIGVQGGMANAGDNRTVTAPGGSGASIR
jgi:hypothetical protein